MALEDFRTVHATMQGTLRNQDENDNSDVK